jgi:FkbM family methyltransferase
VFRQICRPGDVVVDVGANIGTHTLALSRIVGPSGVVYAFEPQRILFQALCATMALNSVTNVLALHAAAGTEAGFVHMPEVDYSRPNNFGGISATEVETSGTRRVHQFRLDDVLAERPAVRFIKIDVEGMERDVLLGATDIIRTRRPILYVENDRVPESKALLETLQELGYRAYWHFPAFFNPQNFFSNPDSIYYHGLTDSGDEHYLIVGYAINLLCMPREFNASIVDMAEVQSTDEHPLKRDCPLLRGMAVVDSKGAVLRSPGSNA